ncbi:MAG: uroporphyrinogen decarboxylase family protein [Candidatus Sumerlaeaceae bacterium]|nr:uroporphyrinogen decarboxylase family protein [Candidatus Sumerlaeaceae bacterium]
MRIDIDYDPSRIAGNKKRWDAAFALSVADRPPVSWGAAPRLMLGRRGSNFHKFFDDPVDQLTELVLNYKWQVENLPGDLVTDLNLTIQPQFENASNANAFGSPTLWGDTEPPQAMRAVESIDQVVAFRPPAMETTLWGRMIEYYHAMKRWLDDGNIEITMRGEPVRIDLQLHTGGESPFCIATDLIGSDIYQWILEYPDEMLRFFEITTDHVLSVERDMREIAGLPAKGRWFLTDDTAQIISAEDYREFVVPFSGRIYDELTSKREERIMHLCGRHVHLYDALVNDLRIAGIWGMGSPNKPEEVRDGIGGKIWMIGNLDPVLLCSGPREHIVAETRRLLDALLPCGGLIVGDGYNLVPETPIENLQLVVDTVREYCGAAV